MDRAAARRHTPPRFGRRRVALAVPAPWPADALPFFLKCWAGATALILIWVG